MITFASFDLFAKEKGPRILIDPASVGINLKLKIMGRVIDSH
jgi:hypothetical protein